MSGTPRVIPNADEGILAMVTASTEAVFIQTHGCFTFANDATARLFGVDDVATLIGQPALSWFHPDVREFVAARIRRANENREVLERREERIVRPDGTVVHIEVSSIPVDFRGEPGALVSAIDITARKEAEEALRVSEDRLRFALERSATGVWEVTAEGDLGYHSRELDRIFGYEGQPPEWTRELLLSHIVPEDREIVAEALKAADGTPGEWGFECRIRRLDCEIRWIIATGGYKRESESEGARAQFAGIIRDVTARHEAEARRAELEEQLRQSQKMDSVGQLAGGMAHDFNNLLMIQRGYCEILRLNLRDDDPLASALDRIDGCAERATALISQLLAFSRKQTLKPRAFDLNELVDDLDHMLHRLLGEDVDLVTTPAPQAATVMADPGQMEQVIVNLAINARDAMPQGGRLAIETRHIEVDPQYVRGREGLSTGPWVMLTVSDTGVGMDEETRQRIFEPFFTTKPEGKGTGLGLSTVYGIVRQSGGAVWVESTPGGGTTFRVCLPRAEGEPELLDRPEYGVTRGSGETVLVVEDEPALCELAELMLENLGYRAKLAANGGAALLMVEEQGLRPDVILTDVIMPGMTGRTLVERIRRTIPDIGVVYMSGHTRNVLEARGVDDGELDVLKKPFSLNDLSARLRAILRRRGPAA